MFMAWRKADKEVLSANVAFYADTVFYINIVKRRREANLAHTKAGPAGADGAAKERAIKKFIYKKTVLKLYFKTVL